MTDPMPTVGVVVLAWQAEPYLAECVSAVLASAEVQVRVILVDNGCDPDDLLAVGHHDRVEILKPGWNTGFAGGCNLAAEKLDTDFLAFVNSDCVIAPDVLAALTAEATQSGIGPVMASIRLADRPEVLNSAGNPVHVIGLSWAGEMECTENRTEPFDVTGASGACLMIRRSLWEDLGGFADSYFAYLEDTELSLRCWRLGLASRCVPTAVAAHHYEFSRNSNKMYLLERNRLQMVSTLWSRRALVVCAPILLLSELLLLGFAVLSGWGPQKVRGWWWIWRHRVELADRRRVLQSERTQPDAAWMARLTPDLDPQAVGFVARPASLFFRAYWALVRRAL
jgi:GT2 family glycosyltransferase